MKRLLIVVVLVGFCLPAFGQTDASIRGTVTDPTGDPVAKAGVTVLNAETGLARSATTNAAGIYSVPNLPVGTYLVTVEVEGFQTVLIQNVVLTVGVTRQVDAQLEVGELAEEITVTSSSVIVETIGGEVAGLITGEQVRELPLNGRNFLQLTQLMPGVSAPEGFNVKNKGLLTGSDLSVSGGGVTANLFTVDGAHNNDVGSNRTVLVYPSVEAIEEFKIHRNAYGAEFGGAGGAQVNLITRGGTNDLQGSVFYFKRDDSFNETNLILRRAKKDTEPLDRDDYGFTLGGALKRDKIHFFVSTEWNDEIRGVARSARVPTAAEKRGDFSQTDPACSQIPVDPLTGQPFPGNVIPADRLSEAGLLYMSLYPDANVSGSCTNWADAVSVPIDWEQINGRLDWSVNSSTRVMLRYTDDDWDNPGPSAGEENGLWGDDAFPAADSAWAQPSESLVAQLNSIIGSSAINTVTFSQSGNEINIAQAGDINLINDLNAAIPSFFPDGDKTASNRSHPLFWGGGGYPTLWSISPWQNDMDITLLKDDYEQVFGNHVVKAGALYSESKKLEFAAGSFQEAPIFWGSFPGSSVGLGGWGTNTGNTIADFLLEDMFFGFSEQSFNPVPDIRWEDLEFYVADSWKIRPNMTLDYGIRYSRFDAPYHNDSSVYTMFDPALFDPALGGDPCNGIVFVPGNDPCGALGFTGGIPGPNKALVNDDTDNFAPRLGFAWDLKGDGDSVVRVGFGQFFQRERVSPQLGFLNNPGAGVGFAGGIRNLDGTDIRPDFVAIGGLPSGGFDPNSETPYMLQYNVSWEQRLGRDSTIEVGYVASRGRHLLRSNEINQVPAGDPNGNGIPDRLEHARCPGGDGGAGCRASFRPFGVFGDRNIIYWTTDGQSEYDSLQTQYTLRYGRGSQLQASYTLSDFNADQDVGNSSGGLGEQTTTDQSNPGLDFGPASLDREHIFNASVIHNLPTFEGQGGFKEHFLGNWTVGAIVIYSSGVPLSIFAADPGGPLQGETPSGTGFDDNFRPIRTGASCAGSGGSQFLNPDAFTLTGYRLGETSQMSSRGVCTGPEFFQVDLSFYKRIPVAGDRVNIQLRIEAFNIFNANNYTDVDTNWGGSDVTLDAPLESATTITGANPQPTFGTAFGARDPRQFQLGVKVTF